MKVIAVIPNYNMLASLKQLLQSLVVERLDAVYVLDDASTDGSADYVEANFPTVTVVRGRRNVGAGANRNRVIPELTGDELILFLDADLELRSKELTRVVRKWFSGTEVGLIGGQILAKSGKPMFWNYGPAMNPIRDSRVQVYNAVRVQTRVDSRAFKVVREMALVKRDTYNFEIQLAESVVRRVDWVAEGLFAVSGQLFRELGGFDERFRYHADQDLGVRVKDAGYEVWFKPDIVARHLEVDVRGETRRDEFRAGQYLYYRKHWGMSRKVFDRLFPTDES
jgi:GT2 family glycosyltransferase